MANRAGAHHLPGHTAAPFCANHSTRPGRIMVTTQRIAHPIPTDGHRGAPPDGRVGDGVRTKTLDLDALRRAHAGRA
jgi:hypothetical protein